MTKERRMTFILLKRLIAVIFMSALLFSSRSFADASAASNHDSQVAPHGPSFKGKRARNFVLHDLAGKRIALKDYAGKPVVINFWAAWCPPCLQEMPWFEELSRKYAGSDLTVLGLSMDIEVHSATPEKIASTAKRLGVTYPILISQNSLHALYGPVHLLPETFYVDRKGVIAEDVWGQSDKETMEKYMREIIK
jgi:thiol-disulfide isomerase/thioredoxin